MTDPDTNYAKNAELVVYFGGNTVPGDDSIEESFNLQIKNQIDRQINRACGYSCAVDGDGNLTTHGTDDEGDFNAVFHQTYGEWVRSGNFTVSQANQDMLKAKYRAPALAMG
jgi:hypothetical protein